MIVSQRIIDLLAKVEEIERRMQLEDAVDDRRVVPVRRDDSVKERLH